MVLLNVYVFLVRAIAVEKEQKNRTEVSERSKVRPGCHPQTHWLPALSLCYCVFLQDMLSARHCKGLNDVWVELECGDDVMIMLCFCAGPASLSVSTTETAPVCCAMDGCKYTHRHTVVTLTCVIQADCGLSLQCLLFEAAEGGKTDTLKKIIDKCQDVGVSLNEPLGLEPSQAQWHHHHCHRVTVHRDIIGPQTLVCLRLDSSVTQYVEWWRRSFIITYVSMNLLNDDDTLVTFLCTLTLLIWLLFSLERCVVLDGLWLFLRLLPSISTFSRQGRINSAWEFKGSAQTCFLFLNIYLHFLFRFFSTVDWLAVWSIVRVCSGRRLYTCWTAPTH